MTLSGITLFPQAMLPLYVFEPRYRDLFADALASNRVVCLAGQNDALAEQTGQYEPPFDVAAIGLIRASQLNDDGTSNVVVQGLSRVRIVEIVQEDPYRIARIEPLETFALGAEAEIEALRQEMLSRLRNLRHYKFDIPDDLLQFFESIDDPDGVADLGIYTFCVDAREKQTLLETLDTGERLRRFNAFLRRQNEKYALEARLRGDLSDDDIEKN